MQTTPCSPEVLHLIRHAKSSWSDPELHDSERPLNKRGVRACAIMAEHMVAAGCDFSNLYCSPATRAQQTIQCIAEALPDHDLTWQTKERLYTFSSSSLWRLLSSLENIWHPQLVIVGHNPALTDFVNEICDHQLDNIPTCGYVQLKLTKPISQWSELQANGAELTKFLYPKMY